jgi:hypothetical protein
MTAAASFAGVLALSVSAFQHQYHHVAFQQSKAAYEKESEIYAARVRAGWLHSPSNSVINQQYHYHLRRLVEIGAVMPKTHRLRHIHLRTPESIHFGQKLESLQFLESGLAWSKKPDGTPADTEREEAESTTGGLAATWDLVAEAYMRPDQVETWEKFIRDHDVPDYADRYMNANQ